MTVAVKRERAEVFKALEREIHDLCQPLTTLQCRLELAQMSGDECSLREAVDGGLVETARLFDGIALLRKRLLGDSEMIARDEF